MSAQSVSQWQVIRYQFAFIHEYEAWSAVSLVAGSVCRFPCAYGGACDELPTSSQIDEQATIQLTSFVR
jgi:hypothetical protein